MGAGSSLLHNATGSTKMLADEFAATEGIKRAKTPMVNRFEVPNYKQRLTIQNIERMETQIKDHLDGTIEGADPGAATAGNSPRASQGKIDLATVVTRKDSMLGPGEDMHRTLVPKSQFDQSAYKEMRRSSVDNADYAQGGT